ncbi:hypothetical protein IQ268_10180 [Oculatella sp. LEGE 06141]|uniref:hypothetical protein n=1 Tax=Oculatella sp. LEGE 06141 TaxID=1828648 RepID=UPI0019F291D7|nr:hypothetical protein [Oculatella sp. LEGE 06141]MBE9178928.1 hypothetical protein [Oculatella sp. LEGE 06141]
MHLFAIRLFAHLMASARRSQNWFRLFLYPVSTLEVSFNKGTPYQHGIMTGFIPSAIIESHTVRTNDPAGIAICSGATDPYNPTRIYRDLHNRII